MKYQEAIEKRRTFGIISHPDAGKTNFNRKIIAFWWCYSDAGAVKNNKIKKPATSDFMEIENREDFVKRLRNGFWIQTKQINILDTPGHKDFAEDTLRTLTAVDSVILVIDCANGERSKLKSLWRFVECVRRP